MNLQRIRAIASQVALEAGEMLRGYYGRSHQETTKQNAWDVVTEGDKASEAIIVPALREAFPEYPIMSEEGGGGALTDAEYTWYIDPIDGTTNFANNLPWFSISIALSDRDLNPVVGVVYAPILDELFSAARGMGATLNDQPLRVSSITDLNRAVLTTGFPYSRATEPDNNLRQWADMLMRVRDLRRFGSAALELAYVGGGRLDGFWEKHINAWDVQAGICIALEAGAIVTDYTGALTMDAKRGKTILAAAPGIHPQVLDALNATYR